MDDGISLVVGGSAIGAIATLAGSWLKARATTRKIEPQPLEVRPASEWAERKANDEDHAAIFLRLAAVEQRTAAQVARMERVEAGVARIEDKLDRLILHTARISCEE